MISPQEVAVVILAAGRSTRFGRPKLLEQLYGEPVVGHILRVADKFTFANKLAVVPASSAPLKGFI